MASGGSPCGACKFLRRKCATDCVFAPYFCSEQGPARFAAIHKVFGASNVSKLLLHVPVADRCEAVVTIAYEAQARIRDPVYGCVSHIFALQQQVAYLQAQVMQMKAQILAQSLIDEECRQQSSRNAEHEWPLNLSSSSSPMNNYNMNMSPQSSFDQIQSRADELMAFQVTGRKRHSQTDSSELQALALRMMKNQN